MTFMFCVVFQKFLIEHKCFLYTPKIFGQINTEFSCLNINAILPINIITHKYYISI